MSRLAVSACLAALMIASASPGAAQTTNPRGPSTPDIGGFPDSPLIPAPTQETYPGVIKYEVDAEITAKGEDGLVTLRFDLAGPALDDAIREVGVMPLPP